MGLWDRLEKRSNQGDAVLFPPPPSSLQATGASERGPGTGACIPETDHAAGGGNETETVPGTGPRTVNDQPATGINACFKMKGLTDQSDPASDDLGGKMVVDSAPVSAIPGDDIDATGGRCGAVDKKSYNASSSIPTAAAAVSLSMSDEILARAVLCPAGAFKALATKKERAGGKGRRRGRTGGVIGQRLGDRWRREARAISRGEASDATVAEGLSAIGRVLRDLDEWAVWPRG